MIEIYEMEVKPRALEMNEREEIKVTAIVDYLQQIAYEHAYHLGVSFQQTFKKNLTWYLLRYYIEIYDYPKLTDVLTVRSWPVKNESEKYSLRDFQILTQTGKIICNATTSWILYNFIKRKPVNYKDYFKDIPRSEQRAVNYDFPNLPLPEKVDYKVDLVVRRSDLDLNRHVNNRVYFEWVLETVPKKQLDNYKITKIEISYKGQALHNDNILVETELNKSNKKDSEIITNSKISKKKNGELLSKVKLYWIKN